jgi:hypothetical protein
MATILVANTGNWSATGTWAGGVVPTAGDIVVANNRTVTIDTLNVNVAEVRNDTTGGAVAGGSFNMSSGGSLTADIYAGTTAAHCVSWAGSAGQTATVTGNFFGGSGSGHAISCTSGNLVIGGASQSTGGTGGGTSMGLLFSSPGTLTFATAGSPGVITGGTSTNTQASGVTCSGNGSTINIFATSIRGSTSGVGNGHGLLLAGTGQTVNLVATNIGAAVSGGTSLILTGPSANFNATISGNMIGASTNNAPGATVNSSGTYNFTVAGNIIGNAGNAYGFNVGSSGAIVNLTANVTGSGFVSSIVNSSPGTLNIIGTVTAGPLATTVVNSTTGTLRCTRAVGNGFGLGSTGINSVVAVSSGASGSLTYIEQLQFGPLGQTPVSGPIRLTANTGNVAQFVTTTGTTKTLVDTAATSGVLPPATDVRTGVVYSSGNLTGTCAVPAAGSVALGVPVDATTGTAVLTEANVRAAVGLASANLDAQLDALPTTAEIWSHATGRTITGGTVDTLTNAPSVPSASAIASQVRTELSTELGRIDATVSSRLAPGGTLARVTLVDTTTTVTNSSQVDNSAIADAVRVELQPELARVANTATTQEVADIVEGAAALP